MTVSIKFLGAAGTVTGSKYLISGAGKKILVDAGLFQGKREHRERNWRDPNIDLSEIDAVLLTHAHLDHTGILPRYSRLGLKCPVYATPPTVSLANLLLPDSGYLQEEEAEYRKRRGKSRHTPPLPLYTLKDAKRSLSLLKPVRFHHETVLFENITAVWKRMGHILGAASIELRIDNRLITFSGDIGRYTVPILKDPEPAKLGDLLLVESTYGDRLHKDSTPKATLSRIIIDTYSRGGVVVIPSFAVGRAQLLLYYLRELKEEKQIPNLPVFLDSPMACDATSIYRQHPADYDEESLEILRGGRLPFSLDKLTFVKKTQDSINLHSVKTPAVIISASGMLTGGRILHHLKHRISSEKNSVVFVGYQPPGGRGAWIQSGAEHLRIFGDEMPIRARIETISGLSAHGDRDELLRWCRQCESKPDKAAIVHGEPESAEAFKKTLKDNLGWDCFRAGYLQTFNI